MAPTARGYGLLSAGVLLLGAGTWYGYRELAALGGAALAACLGAVAFVAWRPRLTVVRTVDPDRVMRGEASDVTLRVSNASRFFGASVVARDRCASRPGSMPAVVAGSAGSSVPVPLVRLRPGRETTVTYPAPTRRRGVIAVGPLEITRRDPLGLAGVVRRYGDAATVWVRPRVHVVAAVPVGLSRSMDGRIDRVPQGTITFSTLREYVAGDDLRHVHWRTSARVGELMVREHVDTSLPRIVLLLDNRACAHVPDGAATLGRPRLAKERLDPDAAESPTFEAACEAAASVAVAAVREDVHVELHLIGGASAAGSHAHQAGGILDLLAEASLTGDGDLRQAIERLRARRVGDTLLYLTGPPDQDDLGLLASLRGAYPSIIAGVFGPVEAGLGATAGILVVGAVDGADFAAAWDGVRAW